MILLSWGGEFALSLCARLHEVGLSVEHRLLCSEPSFAAKEGTFGIVSNKLHNLCDKKVVVIWWPAFTQGSLPKQNLDVALQAERQFEAEQWITIAWLTEVIDCEFPLGKPSDLMKWSTRPSSMFLAKKLGLKIPRFKLAFDGAEATEFLTFIKSSGGSVILKRLSDNRFFSDGRASISVNVESTDFSDMGELSSPVWLEERLYHRDEVRLFVVGTKVKAFKVIDESINAVDSRIDGKRKFIKVKPSASIAAKLISLTEAMDLKYCCFDVLMAENEPTLIDINPLGTTDGFPESAGKEVQTDIAIHILSWVQGTFDEMRTQ